jgi:hypothetical protein
MSYCAVAIVPFLQRNAWGTEAESRHFVSFQDIYYMYASVMLILVSYPGNRMNQSRKPRMTGRCSYSFSLIVVGDAAVGKTSIISAASRYDACMYRCIDVYVTVNSMTMALPLYVYRRRLRSFYVVLRWKGNQAKHAVSEG